MAGYLKVYLYFTEKETENWRQETLSQASQLEGELSSWCHPASSTEVSELRRRGWLPQRLPGVRPAGMCTWTGQEAPGGRTVCAVPAEKRLCFLEKVSPPQAGGQGPPTDSSESIIQAASIPNPRPALGMEPAQARGASACFVGLRPLLVHWAPWHRPSSHRSAPSPFLPQGLVSAAPAPGPWFAWLAPPWLPPQRGPPSPRLPSPRYNCMLPHPACPGALVPPTLFYFLHSTHPSLTFPTCLPVYFLSLPWGSMIWDRAPSFSPRSISKTMKWMCLGLAGCLLAGLEQAQAGGREGGWPGGVPTYMQGPAWSRGG